MNLRFDLAPAYGVVYEIEGPIKTPGGKIVAISFNLLVARTPRQRLHRDTPLVDHDRGR
jgi:hypothetical protein